MKRFLVAIAPLLLAGCGLVPGLGASADGGVPYPDGCDQFHLSARRCQAIVESVGRGLGAESRAVAGIELLGDPGCGDAPGGQQVLCTRTTAFVVRVRYNFVDGPSEEQPIFCGVGGQWTIQCTNKPEIRIATPIEGFFDTPCAGEPPAGCATPLPTFSPDGVAASESLKVASLDIPIDHEGAYAIEVGHAKLANGVLRAARFDLVDPFQDTFLLVDGSISLGVIGEDGKPIANAYDHGWRAGVEDVRVILAFEVDSFEPGTVLQARDLVVR